MNVRFLGTLWVFCVAEFHLRITRVAFWFVSRLHGTVTENADKY